jgi:hypothetical protein
LRSTEPTQKPKRPDTSAAFIAIGIDTQKTTGKQRPNNFCQLLTATQHWVEKNSSTGGPHDFDFDSDLDFDFDL